MTEEPKIETNEPKPAPKILTIIQARTSSTRLPRKVLLPLGNSTVLGQMLERVKRSKLRGTLVVATTPAPIDRPILAICEKADVPCFLGDPLDLLDRHYRAWATFGGDAVVKIPSDCPLIDPRVIDRVLTSFLEAPEAVDFVSNLHPQSYPDGNDVEVMTAKALETAWREAKKTIEREHTTPFLWDNPERFRLKNVLWETGLDYSQDYRWVLDYAEDYDAIRAIFNGLSPEKPEFGVEDIVSFVTSHPEVRAMNQKHLGDAWYQRHQNELRTRTTSAEATL